MLVQGKEVVAIHGSQCCVLWGVCCIVCGVGCVGQAGELEGKGSSSVEN